MNTFTSSKERTTEFFLQKKHHQIIDANEHNERNAI